MGRPRKTAIKKSDALLDPHIDLLVLLFKPNPYYIS